MIFELIAWICITLICYAWGSLTYRICFSRQNDAPKILFSVICFSGLLTMGLVAWYFSLFFPIHNAVKIVLTIPVLFYYLRPANRKLLTERFRAEFDNLGFADYILLTLCILMLALLTSSPVIHPDSLNYHVYSIRFYDHYGIVPGIANLKPEFGIQSLWFIVLNIFDFSLIPHRLSFPLNGCFLCWFIIFLISKAANRKTGLSSDNSSFYQGAWYLILLLFTLLSWTQIRLTASSLSPDFIAAVCVLLSLYYLTRRTPDSQTQSIYLAVFFALMAVCIKVSVVVILLLPFFVIVDGVINHKFKLAVGSFLTACVILVPFLIRNVVSSGYPLYPASIAGSFPFDWKLSLQALVRFQHYITGFARYPIIAENTDSEFNQHLLIWLPRWWDHQYVADKLILLMIVFGLIPVLIAHQMWKRQFSKMYLAAFLISVAGVIMWFIHAPDPRFGTGFLIPLLYFQYAPFWTFGSGLMHEFYPKFLAATKWIASFLILAYLGYRMLNFFEPGQLVFPAGVKQIARDNPGCDEQIKQMMLQDNSIPSGFPDSCKTFIFRGKLLKDGFRSVK